MAVITSVQPVNTTPTPSKPNLQQPTPVVNPGSGNSSNSGYHYILPTRSGTSSGDIQSFVSAVKDLEGSYQKYALSNPLNNALKQTEVGVLSYLAKRYYTTDDWPHRLGFSILSKSGFDPGFENYLNNHYKALIKKVSPYMSDKEIGDKFGGIIDLPHLAVTTLSYYNFSLNSGSWNGWAGDLASAMKFVQRVHNANKGANLDTIARAFVGGSSPSADVPKGVTIPSDAGNTFGYIDMCTDADAIGISNLMKKKSGNNLLSSAMEDYYKGASKKRFSNYLMDLGARKDFNSIKKAVDSVLDGVSKYVSWLESRTLNDSVREACKKAFAHYVYHSS